MSDTLYLGKCHEASVFYDINNAYNGHICTTGKSGSGKSVQNQKMILEISEKGGTVLALSLHNTLAKSEVLPEIRDRFFEHANIVEAYDNGILCPLFDKPTSSYEEKARIDAIGAITDVFVRAYGLKSRQTSTIRKAIAEVYDEKLFVQRGISAIGEILSMMKTDVAETVYQKMLMLIEHNVFLYGDFFLMPGKINIVNLDRFDALTQNAVAEVLLSYVWRLATIGEFKAEPLYIFVDEAQHLSFTKGSTLAMMLTEGRKMNIRLMLATQYTEKRSQFANLLNQSDLQLFFQPGLNETRDIASKLDSMNVDVWNSKLSTLQVGEFIAKGSMLVDGINVRGPLKVDARIIPQDEELGKQLEKLEPIRASHNTSKK